MEPLLALIVPFGLLWLLVIRPQQRRMRQHQAVVAALDVGDEVVTAGGIQGTVVALEDDSIRLEVAPGVVLRVLRGAVSQRTSPDDGYDEYDDDVDDEDDDDEDDAVTDGGPVENRVDASSTEVGNGQSRRDEEA